MADIGAGFAGPVIEVVKWVAQPILRHFNYLCCFTTIITGLEHEAKELDLATRELQERVERERENVQVISPQVESWLSKSNDIKGQKDTILDEVPSVKSGCLKLGARFSLSRRAKKTTDRIKELRVHKNLFIEFPVEDLLQKSSRSFGRGMAEIVAAFAGPVIEVVKWVAQPILRQFNYLCCFTTIITGLEREAEELDRATRGLQGQVDRGRENVQVISPQVESWLSKSNDIKGQKDTILDEVPSVKSGCLKLGARFSLSRRAKKTTDCIKELRLQRRNFNAISQPGPPAAAQELPLGKTYDFESRKKIEEDIMATLRDGDVNIIGICGMGGLGKTTMARRIMNRVLKEHVFEEAVITTISQKVDGSNVQVEIGGTLGLNLQHDTSQVRVQKLHTRLTGTKRILLVLDDVWEGLELQSLGIPCNSKGCTILVTSRNKDALSKMDVQKVFGMEVLPPEDAWFLLRERAGTCVDDARLNPIAKEVVAKCGGLPVALIAVGAALKDEKDVSVWKDARRQLRRCDQDIPSFIKEVYNPVKLSYDFLRSWEVQSLLLLCCLFPEDAWIPLEKLTYFCMGLGIFEGIMNPEGARNKTRTLAKMLKSRSLLLDCFDEDDYVRMHDVVRDVCRIIAKQGKYIGGNDCAWISSAELIRERTSGLGFLNLRLLLLMCISESEEEFKLDNAFLEGISGLHVLWIERSSLTSLPQGTQQLKNLNTLVLWGCEELKTMSVVGELVNLEILICHGCDLLEELPPGMKGLNRLKLLELSKCISLQSIGRGIISSLVGLEELKMFDSFNKWEAEDKEERKNAGLKELQSLTNLTCLEIEIEDSALVAENMHISTKLDRFFITFCKSDYLPPKFHRYEKRMSLHLVERETCLGHWIEMQLLRETESLSLRGNGAKIVDLRICQNIKWLNLSECEMMKSIVTASLEHMDLYSLPQLQEVSISFQNLSSLTIWDCPRLPNLANLSTAGNDCLPHLERIWIERCEMMEQVLLWKEEDNNSGSRIINPHHVKFPKLKMIFLDSLPNLDTFCRGIEGIELPLLMEIYIENCPKRKNMVSCSCILESKEDKRGGAISGADIDEHIFCQFKKVSFSNLKVLRIDRNPFCGHEIPASSYQLLEELTIWGYEGSRTLLPSSIAKNLINIKRLSIEECEEIEQVIKDDDEEEREREANANLFPKLEELQLRSLPKLVSFCELKCDVVLPSLREATIRRCPKMKNWSLGCVAAPKLEKITTDLDHQPEFGVNLSFDRLKMLWINARVGNLEYPFYHHKIFISCVDGLEELELYKLGSMSTFPYSVVGKLVNLRSLEITKCDEMVKVIEEEEEDEVVVSGGRTTLLFPKLEELVLWELPKLERFCERKCVVELPSLQRVIIVRCPMMKSFSLGPLTAPNLESIRIDDEYISGGEKDLNGEVQQRYLITQQKKEKEEKEEEAKTNTNKEGGEDEQKSNGEIVEHQS